MRNKKAQEEKCKIFAAKPKKAQEEMVGFALIVIIVAVILLVFVGITLRNQDETAIESYEVESFLSSSLQYTSSCETNLEYLTIQKLIFACYEGNSCLDGESACQKLESSFKGILGEVWPIQEDSSITGYELTISVGEEVILNVNEGEGTQNYKGSLTEFSRSTRRFEISLKVFY